MRDGFVGQSLHAPQWLVVDADEQVEPRFVGLLHNAVGTIPVELTFGIAFDVTPGKDLFNPTKAHLLHHCQITWQHIIYMPPL